MSTDLRKSMSLPMLVALGAAGIIGSSWVYTASAFFRAYGAGGEIFGLVLGALLATCVASAYGELVARFPRAGGEVVFAFVAFGRGVAFLAGWLLIGAYVSSLAFYVTASGMLLGNLLPGVESVPLYTVAGTTVSLPVLAIGAGLCLVVWLVAAAGMGLAGGVQLALFGAMVAMGALLAAVGFATGRPAHFWPAYAAGAHPVTSTVRFLLPAMTYLTGFSLITTLAEDADVPPRRIATAVMTAVPVAAAFYCTVLLATAWIVPWTSTATLHDGVIGAFRLAGYPWLAWGAFAISVLGLLTSFLALFTASSRLILALARGGLLPPALSRIDHGGQPRNALVLTLVLTLGLGWLGQGALLWFLDAGGLFVGLAWCAAVASLYRVRRMQPPADVPFRAWPFWLPGLGAAGASCVIVATLAPGTSLSLEWPHEYAIVGAWLGLGGALYLLASRAPEGRGRAAVLGSESPSPLPAVDHPRGFG